MVQPGRQGGVGGARGGVFHLRRLADEGAYGQVVVAAGAARIDAQAHGFGVRGQQGDVGPGRRQRTQRGFVAQLGQPPAAAAVHQHRRQRAQGQAGQHRCQSRVVQPAGFQHAGARRTHRQATSGAFALDADRQQADGAFLHQQAVARRRQAGVEHGVGAADAGMAGEGHFPARAEDAQPVAGLRRRRRQHEGGFRQAGPAGDGLHRGFVERAGVEHHGQRIAVARPGGENVELYERVVHRGLPAQGVAKISSPAVNHPSTPLVYTRRARAPRTGVPQPEP